MYKVLYDAAALHLIEDDYTTTDWEGCKGMINQGKIGCMVLGSWAYPQMVEAGPNGDDIGYMSFPITVNGKQYASAGADYSFGINKNSSEDDQMAQSMTAKSNRPKLSFKDWFALPRVQKWFVIVAFAIVPLLLLLVFTYIPFGKMIEYSLYDRSYTKVRAFVGLKNYARIFTKKDYFDAMFLSLYYMGQNMVMFIGAIMSVDPTLYEAAQIDGANRWKQFLYIILPSIKTIVMLNVILSITGSLSAFEPPYVIMGGGASGTATYFIKMHQAAHIDQKVGMACAMAVVLMIVIIFATILQKLFFRYVLKEGVDDAAPVKKKKKAVAAARV